MATFPIHLDSEKENSHFSHKEKIFNSRASNVLQPIGRAGAGLGLKEKISIGGAGGGRSVYSDNGNQQLGRVGGVATKAAFREVGNVKVNDENSGNFAPTAATKKTIGGGSTVPVEQFKTFSVYEDKCETQENIAPKTENVAKIETIITSSSSVDDKENHFTEQPQQRLEVVAKRDTFHEEFQVSEENEFILDTTPMSVTDVLSPMSVDRSINTNSTSILTDDSTNNKKCNNEEDLKPLPRNDRERFYEVIAYQRNILEYFRESEKKHRPKPHYMRRQADINYSMRTILVDWLVEVSEEYNLDTETLYLSVSYIDRFLSHMSVVRSKLQLVGTAAMYIASKYEEIYPPEVAEFVFITDDTYSKAQVLRMEQIILKILAFDLCTPTAYVFINTYAVLADVPEKIKCLAQYISELSLLEADPYLRFCPSLISAASLGLARYTVKTSIWSTQLEEITTYRLEDLREVLLYLNKSHQAAATLAQQAIQEKYKLEKLRRVSIIQPVELDEAIFDELAREYNAMQAAAENKIEPECKSTSTTSNENVRRMISLMFN